MVFPSDQYEIKSLVLNTQNRSYGSIEAPNFILPQVIDFNAVKVKNALIGFSVYPIDSRNNKVYFRELRDTTLGSFLTATITPGYYTGTTLATELDTQMSGAGSNNYSTAYDSITNKISISSGNANHTMLFTTGSNSINYELGVTTSMLTTFGSTFLTDQIDISGVKAINIASNIGGTEVFSSQKRLLATIPTVAENLKVDLFIDDSDDYINIKQSISEISLTLYDERMRTISGLDKDFSINLLFLQKN